MLKVIIVFLILLPYLLYLAHLDRLSDSGLHLYGIYGFFGLPGKGKTIAMSKYLLDLRKKYGDKIYIMTNYGFSEQDFEFRTWKQLLKDYDKPLIVAWDEIQNEFNSRDFKSFPIQLMTQLTQVRKGNGCQILYTAQKWHFVDKNFRSLTFACYQCNTWLGRYTYTKKYSPEVYDDLCNQVQTEKKRRLRPQAVEYFIQTDDIRSSYDSFKMLQSAKAKEYMTREELAVISGTATE